MVMQTQQAEAAAKRRGRPRKDVEDRGERVPFRVPASTISALQRIADQQGKDLATVTRQALEMFAKTHGEMHAR